LSASGGSQQGEAPTRLKLLRLVTDAAGVLRTSERALGGRLGISSTRARRLLSELATAGAIKVRASSTGTTITLLAGGMA
jgi:predicted ArsR family transcriptional regulator